MLWVFFHAVSPGQFKRRCKAGSRKEGDSSSSEKMFQGALFSLRHNGKAVVVVPERIGFYFEFFFFFCFLFPECSFIFWIVSKSSWQCKGLTIVNRDNAWALSVSPVKGQGIKCPFLSWEGYQQYFNLAAVQNLSASRLTCPRKRTHYLSASVISRVFLGELKHNQPLHVWRRTGIWENRNIPCCCISTLNRVESCLHTWQCFCLW